MRYEIEIELFGYATLEVEAESAEDARRKISELELSPDIGFMSDVEVTDSDLQLKIESGLAMEESEAAS